MKEQIEEAIKSTLVVENKESIKHTTDKIMDLFITKFKDIVNEISLTNLNTDRYGDGIDDALTEVFNKIESIKGKVYAKIAGKYIECTETIEDLENKVSKWISVNDKLPEKGEHILFFDNSGICLGWYSGTSFNESRRFGENVTHWMRLPLCPKL